MKAITDIIFPKEFKTEAEEYIAYKRSLGFKFSMDDQRKLLYMLNHIYIHNHNDVTHLTKEVVDSFLSLSNGSKPRTLHANQSFIRQYGLYLQLNGHDSYVYPDKLIQCPKDFVPYIFTKEEYETIITKFYAANEQDTEVLNDVLTKVGMTREGILRNRLINDEGRKIDKHIYSILKEEWIINKTNNKNNKVYVK